jgi:hypothetical protein
MTATSAVVVTAAMMIVLRENALLFMTGSPLLRPRSTNQLTRVSGDYLEGAG